MELLQFHLQFILHYQTNGKTTTVTLLFNLFRGLGYNVGLLSTVENKINNTIIPSSHTTPDALTLNELLAQMVEKGCQYAFMEVSSHAIVQHRIAGIKFTGAAFSNITHDHLDYHKTFDEYIKAKTKDAGKIINGDEPMAISIKLVSNSVTREKFTESVIEGFKNASHGKATKEEINKFTGAFTNAFKKGDQINLKYKIKKENLLKKI